MKLQDLKKWINTLPKEFLDYECVYSVYENDKETADSWVRADTLITSCYIDPEHLECSFSKNRPEVLCSSFTKPASTKRLKKSKK